MRITTTTGIGAAVGLTWGLALRSWMMHLALLFDDWPRMTWPGTFLAVLLPATVVGGFIGWDLGTRLSGGRDHRWVIWSPLLLAVGPAILADDFVGTLMDTGEGGGAIGVVLIGLGGGYVLSGRGKTWSRWVVGVLPLVILGAMTFIFYISEAPFTASKAFGGMYLVVLLIWLSAGCSIPMRDFRTDRPGLGATGDEARVGISS